MASNSSNQMTEQSTSKEELGIETLIEKPDVTLSPEKIPHENDTRHGDDMLANKSDFIDDDKTEKSATAKKKTVVTDPSTIGNSLSKRLTALRVQRVKKFLEDRSKMNVSIVNVQKNLADALDKYGSTYCSRCVRRCTRVRLQCCTMCGTMLRYECKICLTRYDFLVDLNDHMNEKHVVSAEPKESYMCKYCSKTFDHFAQRHEHMMNCPDRDFYYCVYCNYEAKFKKDLISHIKNTHKFNSTDE